MEGLYIETGLNWFKILANSYAEHLNAKDSFFLKSGFLNKAISKDGDFITITTVIGVYQICVSSPNGSAVPVAKFNDIEPQSLEELDTLIENFLKE